MIPSSYQSMWYHFERDTNGRPFENNDVYDKLKNGNLMLSPYAMWEIQLSNLTSDTTFNDLIEFRDSVDLELVGYGSFIAKGSKVYDLDISAYYQPEENV